MFAMCQQHNAAGHLWVRLVYSCVFWSSGCIVISIHWKSLKLSNHDQFQEATKRMFNFLSIIIVRSCLERKSNLKIFFFQIVDFLIIGKLKRCQNANQLQHSCLYCCQGQPKATEVLFKRETERGLHELAVRGVSVDFFFLRWQTSISVCWCGS